MGESRSLIGLLALLAVAAPLTAATLDESPCDCSRKIALCQVLPSVETDRIVLNAFSRQCSLVTYRLDGVQRTELIVGGRAELPWSGAQPPTVKVEDCRICDYRANTMDDTPSIQIQ
ncbi:MAG: hypothetical protein R3280_03125 [Marinobacter sp.]|uniref:hypothetical protein n=1 Tax=Marinobacter sp. TaxID=50741 RepID=UPI00299E8334|nr:hypothetical protein [Marinobacter sp.]MDX1633607.1 hypothetical protein [Marinobacter sp.]